MRRVRSIPPLRCGNGPVGLITGVTDVRSRPGTLHKMVIVGNSQWPQAKLGQRWENS